MILPGTVGVVTRSAISARNGSVQPGIAVIEIIVTHVAQARLRLHHAPQGIWIMAGSAFPFSIGIMNHHGGQLLIRTGKFGKRAVRI
jgi:hypothetical protein